MSARTVPPIRTEGLVDRERLREAVTLLREAPPKGLTRKEFARCLGDVSLRTVDRVLRLLEDQGARFERSREGRPAVIRFRLQKGPAWDEHLSSDARMALRLAALSLSHSGTTLWDDKLEAIESLVSDRMSNRDRRFFDRLAQLVQVRGGVEDPIEMPEVLEPVLRALEQGRELEVAYQPVGAPEPRPRIVIPYALSHDLFSGATFLTVWDPADRRPKNFRLNRISAAKVSHRPAVISDPGAMARAARYQIGGWICDAEPFTVEARLHGAHWRQTFEEAPPALPDFEAEPEASGTSLRIRFKANHEAGASRWVLQFGPSLEVLAPEPFRDRIRAQLREALAPYTRGE